MDRLWREVFGPLVILSLGASVSSCAARIVTGAPPPILATAVGPALQAMWEASGGLWSWQRLASVRFTYQAELGPAAPAVMEAACVPKPGAARAGGERGWTGARVGPQEVSFAIGDWSALKLGGDEAEATLLLKQPSEFDLGDYALRSIRVFFAFPFALNDPVWEFRRDLIAGELSHPLAGFWVVPNGSAAPHRAYFVDLDRSSRLPRAIYYQAEHPCLRGKVLKAVFGGYQELKGIRIPTEIRHLVCGPRPAGPEGRYPWEEGERPAGGAESDAEDENCFLRERISAVELIERPARRELVEPEGAARVTVEP